MRYLKDSNGKDSGKRLGGFLSLFFGLGLLLAVGIFSFFEVAADPSTVFGAGTALVAAGSTLLGIGTFERKQNNESTVKKYNYSNGYNPGSVK